MRKEVDLCDNCEKTVADGKCPSCGKDICPNCSRFIALTCPRDYSYNMIFIITRAPKTKSEKSTMMCKECFNKIFDKKILQQNPKPLVTEIIKMVKNHVVALKV